MDYIPQYVTDFLNNYYKLTKRVLSIIKLPKIILEPDVVEGIPLFTEYRDILTKARVDTYALNYETDDGGEVYRYWWRGNYGNLNKIMSAILKSMDNTLEYYNRYYGIIYYKHIDVVNELLSMDDDEFILYIKMINLPLVESLN